MKRRENKKEGEWKYKREEKKKKREVNKKKNEMLSGMCREEESIKDGRKLGRLKKIKFGNISRHLFWEIMKWNGTEKLYSHKHRRCSQNRLSFW